MSQNDSTVAALLAERAGYVQRGKTDRVAQVDEALAAFGVKVDDDEPVKRPAKKRAAHRSDG